MVRDIVDEVDFWVQDGYPPEKSASRTAVPAANGITSDTSVLNARDVNSGEIKELVQDDE